MLNIILSIMLHWEKVFPQQRTAHRAIRQALSKSNSKRLVQMSVSKRETGIAHGFYGFRRINTD